MNLIPQQTLLPGSMNPCRTPTFASPTFASLAAANADAAAKIAANTAPDAVVIVGTAPNVAAYYWTGWTYCLAGGITQVANWEALPSGALVGSMAMAPRLCGHGMFLAEKSASRWAVLTGQMIVSDCGPGTSTSGYDLTATGTDFVALASYTLPAGIFGEGESWGADALMRNKGVYVSGADTAQVRIAGIQLTTSVAANGANRVARCNGAAVRLGGTLVKHTGGLSYGGVTSQDVTVDLSVAQTLAAGIAPGAATNTCRLRQWNFGRLA